MKKSQPLYQQVSTLRGDITTRTSTSKQPNKIARVLEHLLYDGSIQRFEVERLSDHCLHSTISSLSNGYGLKFERQLERVPNYWAEPCTITRYTLPISERRRASNVLLMLGKLLKQRQKVAA